MAEVGADLMALEKEAWRIIRASGATPSFYGYKIKKSDSPYPAAICTSVNDEIVHKAPVSYCLKSGDVLKIDAGVNFKGYITDSAVTVGVGEVSPEAKRMIVCARRALGEGIKEARVGKKTGDIGHAIAETVKAGGFFVVDRLHGHGVGAALHESPAVYNYGDPGSGEPLVPGLVIAIEPMIAVGTKEVIEKPDGSFATKDGSLAAHFEHTVIITETGPEVITEL